MVPAAALAALAGYRVMIGRRLCAVGCSIACVGLLIPRPAAAEVPPALLDHLQLHVSAALLDELARQSVDESLALRDTILGVPVEGRARVTGKTHLRLVPDAHRAVFEIVLQGAARSETNGRSPPVVVRSGAVTRFTLTKRFVLDNAGLASQPATCQAETHSVVTAVETEWPGMRGWLVRRLAWRRVQTSHDEADAIAARHAERDLSRSFDRRCTGLMEQANAWLASGWLRGRGGRERRLCFHTTHDRLYAGATPANEAGDYRPQLPEAEHAAVLAVPVHAIGVSQSLELLGAWLREGAAGLARELTGEPLSAEALAWLAQSATATEGLSAVPSLADGWFRLTLRPIAPPRDKALAIARRVP